MTPIRFRRRGAYYEDGWSVDGFVAHSGRISGEVKRLAEGVLDTFEVAGPADLYPRLATLLESLAPDGDPNRALALSASVGGVERVFYLEDGSQSPVGSVESEVGQIIDDIVGRLLGVPIRPDRRRPSLGEESL